MKAAGGLLVIAMCIVLGTGDAEAGRGIAIINTGEDVMEVGSVKPELKEEVEGRTMAGVKIGVMYSRFGLFWLDIWRWDKKFVLFSGTNVYEIPEDSAREMAAGSLANPLTLTIPPGLMVLIGIAVLIILAIVIGRRKGGDAEPQVHPDAGSPPHQGTPPLDA